MRELGGQRFATGSPGLIRIALKNRVCGVHAAGVEAEFGAPGAAHRLCRVARSGISPGSKAQYAAVIQDHRSNVGPRLAAVVARQRGYLKHPVAWSAELGDPLHESVRGSAWRGGQAGFGARRPTHFLEREQVRRGQRFDNGSGQPRNPRCLGLVVQVLHIEGGESKVHGCEVGTLWLVLETGRALTAVAGADVMLRGVRMVRRVYSVSPDVVSCLPNNLTLVPALASPDGVADRRNSEGYYSSPRLVRDHDSSPRPSSYLGDSTLDGIAAIGQVPGTVGGAIGCFGENRLRPPSFWHRRRIGMHRRDGNMLDLHQSQ